MDGWGEVHEVKHGNVARSMAHFFWRGARGEG